MLGIKSAWLQQRLEGNVESALVHTECQLDALQVLRCGCLTCLPKLILPIAEGPANELLVLPIAIHGLQHQERFETSDHWAAPCNHALFICWVHPHLLPKTGVLPRSPCVVLVCCHCSCSASLAPLMLLSMLQALIEVCCSLYWAGRAASAGRPSPRRYVRTGLVQAAFAQEAALHGEMRSSIERGHIQFGQPKIEID